MLHGTVCSPFAVVTVNASGIEPAEKESEVAEPMIRDVLGLSRNFFKMNLVNCSGWTWEVVEVVPRVLLARTVPFGSQSTGVGFLDFPLASVETDYVQSLVDTLICHVLEFDIPRCQPLDTPTPSPRQTHWPTAHVNHNSTFPAPPSRRHANPPPVSLQLYLMHPRRHSWLR